MRERDSIKNEKISGKKETDINNHPGESGASDRNSTAPSAG